MTMEKLPKIVQKFYERYRHMEMFVWGFDSTITKQSTIGKTYNTSVDALKNVADQEFLYYLIPFLIAKGKLVAIASINDSIFFINNIGGQTLIKAFMRSILRIDGVFTNDNIVSYWPNTPYHGKNMHLGHLADKYNVEKKKIIFFDDNMNCITKAMKEGYNICYVPPYCNFTRKFVSHILSIC